MSALDSVLGLTKRLQKLEKRSRWLWDDLSACIHGDDLENAAAAWASLSRVQYAIAATLDAIHVASKGAYEDHIYRSVDTNEAATGVYKGIRNKSDKR